MKSFTQRDPGVAGSIPVGPAIRLEPIRVQVQLETKYAKEADEIRVLLQNLFSRTLLFAIHCTVDLNHFGYRNVEIETLF